MRHILIIILLVPLLIGHINSGGNQFRHEISLIRDRDTTKSAIICPVGVDAQPNQNEWVSFLQNNLELDSAAIDTIPAGKFTVFAQFAIDEKGKLGEVAIIKDPGYGLGERVKIVLNNYDGCWQPAIINGRETKSYRKQPITFVIEEEMEGECEEERISGLIL